MCLCGSSVHLSAGALRGQRRQMSLELGLQVVVSHPTWALRNKLRFSVRKACILNQWDTSLLALHIIIILVYDMGVLSTCMSVRHEHALLTQARSK